MCLDCFVCPRLVYTMSTNQVVEEMEEIVEEMEEIVEKWLSPRQKLEEEVRQKSHKEWA